MANGNLVIVDDEYKEAATNIVKYGNDLKHLIDEYVTIMDYITTSAISDVEVRDAIQEIVLNVGKFSAGIQDITGKIFRDMNEFISEIDIADDFIY